MLKIIAGKHKNRIIPTIKNANYRPSKGKFREAIFSILTSGEFSEGGLFTEESQVLDLFSGTGSLAFEALSRGAGKVTLIDVNAEYLRAAKQFAETINELDRAVLVNINALHLPKATKSFDLVFIDPPYFNNLAPRAVKALINGEWLKNGAILVIELAKKDDFEVKNMNLIKERIYGNSKLLVLRYES